MTKEERWIALFQEVIGRPANPDEIEKARAIGFDFKQIKNIAGVGFSESSTDLHSSGPSLANQIVPNTQRAQPYHVDSQLAQKRDLWIEHFQLFLHRDPKIEELIVGEDHDYDLATIHQFLNPLAVTQEKTDNIFGREHFQRNLAIALIFIVAVGFSAFLYGFKYYSKDAVIKRYGIAVESGDGKTALAYEAWSDNHQDISVDALTYLSEEHPIERSTEDLKTKFVRTGQQWLVFPKWRILIDPITYVVSSNTDGLAVYINEIPFTAEGNTEVKTVAGQSYKAFRLYPTNYVFEARGKVSDEKIDMTYTSDVDELKETYSSQELVDGIPIALNLTHLSGTVKSNLGQGDIYIDEKKIGTLKDGQFKLDNIAAVGTSKIYVRKTFEDQSYIESTLKRVDEIEDSNEINLDAKVLTDDLAKQVIDTAFSKLAYPTQSSNLEESFTGGSSNTFYKNVYQTVERNTTGAVNRAAKTVDMRDVKIKSVKQKSDKLYEVEFTFVYDFYYAPASEFANSGSILETMDWSASISFQGDPTSENVASNYRIDGQLREAKSTGKQDNLK